MKIDNFMISKDNVALSGTDENGPFTMSGSITDKSAALTKQTGEN